MLRSTSGRIAAAIYLVLFVVLMLQLNPWDWEIESTEKVQEFVYPAASQQDLPDMFTATFFTSPKPCTGEHMFMIQSNAVRSWAHLRPAPKIIIFGNETGTNVLAKQVGAVHVPDCAKSKSSGSPLLGDLFRRVRAISETDIYVFLNTDIMLPQMTMIALASALHHFSHFFMVTHRFRMNVDRWIDFDAAQQWKRDLLRTCENKTLQGRDGLREGESCIIDWANAIDFFAFTADFLESSIPDFIIGRPAYDNWLLSHAIRSGWPAIDATRILTAIHQNHEYGHLGEGAKPKYWFGDEGKYNRELALEHGGWSKGTILHTQWQFERGCALEEVYVRTKAAGSEERNPQSQATTYFNRQEGLKPGHMPASLCAITLKRNWALQLLFASTILCGTLCLYLALSHSRTAAAGKVRSPTSPLTTRPRRST